MKNFEVETINNVDDQCTIAQAEFEFTTFTQKESHRFGVTKRSGMKDLYWFELMDEEGKVKSIVTFTLDELHEAAHSLTLEYESTLPKIFELKNWHVCNQMGVSWLEGNVYDNPKFEDGDYVHTSPIVDIDWKERLVKTKSGSTYHLTD